MSGTILPASAGGRRSRFGSRGTRDAEASPPVSPQSPSAPGADWGSPPLAFAATAAPSAWATEPDAFAPPSQPSYAAAAPAFGPPAPSYAAAAPAYAPPAPSYPPPGAPTGYAAPFGTGSPYGSAPDPRFAPSPAGGWNPGGYAQAPTWMPSGGYPAPPNSSKKTPIVVLSVVGVLVIGLIAAAVGVRAKQAPANRTLAIPPTLLGMPQVHTPESDAVLQDSVKQLETNSIVSHADGAYFGDASQGIVLFAGFAKLNRRPSSSDRSQLSGSHSFDVGGGSITFTPAPAGPFGGQMMCGDVAGAQAPVRICVSIDDGAVVYTAVALSGTTDADADLLSRQMISAVEK